MNNNICTFSECDQIVGRRGARGLCKNHYERWRKAHPSEVSVPRVFPPGMTTYGLVAEVGWDVTDKGCWEWRGARSNGYGVISHKKLHRVHRVVYIENYGNLQRGHVVRHRCDNPPCVNPAHLVSGTQKENVGDAIERGRFRPHGRAPGCGLDSSDHKQIRALWHAEGWTQKRLAGRYGVSSTTIFRIIHNQQF